MTAVERKRIERRIESLKRLADPQRNKNAGERRNAREALARLIAQLKSAAKVARETAYCGKCACQVTFDYAGVCEVCGRAIWELRARINGCALRTTPATYGALRRWGGSVAKQIDGGG